MSSTDQRTTAWTPEQQTDQTNTPSNLTEELKKVMSEQAAATAKEFSGNWKKSFYNYSKSALSAYLTNLIKQPTDPDTAKSKLVKLISEMLSKKWLKNLPEVEVNDILSLEFNWNNFVEYFQNMLMWSSILDAELWDKIKESLKDTFLRNFTQNLISNNFPYDDATISHLLGKDKNTLTFEDIWNISYPEFLKKIFEVANRSNGSISPDNINNIAKLFHKNFWTISIESFLNSLWIENDVKDQLLGRTNLSNIIHTQDKNLKVLESLLISETEKYFEKQIDMDIREDQFLIDNLKGNVKVLDVLETARNDFYKLVKRARSWESVAELNSLSVDELHSLIAPWPINWNHFYKSFVSYIHKTYPSGSKEKSLADFIQTKTIDNNTKDVLLKHWIGEINDNYQNKLKDKFRDLSIDGDVNLDMFLSQIISWLNKSEPVINITTSVLWPTWRYEAKVVSVKVKTIVENEIRWDSYQERFDSAWFNFSFELNPIDLPWNNYLEVKVPLKQGERTVEKTFYKWQTVVVTKSDNTTIEWLLDAELEGKLYINWSRPINISDISNIELKDNNSHIQTDLNNILANSTKYYLAAKDKNANPDRDWRWTNMDPINPDWNAAQNVEAWPMLSNKEKYDIIDNEYKNLTGFFEAKFEKWAVFYYGWPDNTWRINDIEVPNMWYDFHKVVITDFQENWDITFSESIVWKNWTSNITVNLYEHFFEWSKFLFFDLLQKWWSKIFRFGKWLKDSKEFENLVKDGKVSDQFSNMNDKWKKKISEEWLSKVTHIWKKLPVLWWEWNLLLNYKVTFHDKYVNVVDHTKWAEWTMNKDMSYDEFLTFIADKWFSPYTEEEKDKEVKTIEDDNSVKKKVKTDITKVWSPLWLAFTGLVIPWSISILMLKLAIDHKSAIKQLAKETWIEEIIKDYKWKKDEKEKLEKAEKEVALKHFLGKTLGWAPIIWDTIRDLDSESQWKLTTARKGYYRTQLERIEKAWWHWKDASKYIVKEILWWPNDESKAVDTFENDPLKWLAALDYSVKSWWLYFRDLSALPLWRWVLTILWPSHHENFKKLWAKSIASWNKSDLENIELKYIYDNVTDFEASKYFSWVAGTLQWFLERFAEDVQAWYKAQELKDFNEIIPWEYNTMFRAASYGRWWWTIKAASEKTFTLSQYYKLSQGLAFYSIIPHPHVTAINKDKVIESYPVTTWFDLMLKAQSSINWPKEVARLIDAISIKAWLYSDKDKKWFIKEIGYNYDWMLWVDFHSKALEMKDKYDKYWQKYWNKIVDIINMKDWWKIFELASGSDSDAAVIREYLTSTNSSMFDNNNYIDSSLPVDSREFMKQNIWHHTPWTFRNYLADFHDWVYRGKTAEKWDDMWWEIRNSFSSIINKYEEIGKESWPKDAKKYMEIFGQFYYLKLKKWFVRSGRFWIWESDFDKLFWYYFGIHDSLDQKNEYLVSKFWERALNWSVWEAMMYHISPNHPNAISSYVRESFEKMDNLLDIIKTWSYNRSHKIQIAVKKWESWTRTQTNNRQQQRNDRVDNRQREQLLQDLFWGHDDDDHH